MKDKMILGLIIFIIVILIIALAGILITSIYCWAIYTNTPMEEVPSWAVWFMFKL